MLFWGPNVFKIDSCDSSSVENEEIADCLSEIYEGATPTYGKDTEGFEAQTHDLRFFFDDQIDSCINDDDTCTTNVTGIFLVDNYRN